MNKVTVPGLQKKQRDRAAVTRADAEDHYRDMMEGLGTVIEYMREATKQLKELRERIEILEQRMGNARK